MNKDKYRAWDRQSERFVYSGVEDPGNKFLVTNEGVFVQFAHKELWDKLDDNRFEIERLKGRDNKGQKLYVNDIIKVVYPKNDINSKIKVVDKQLIQGIFAQNKIIKLGNIHQNPEILGDKNDT